MNSVVELLNGMLLLWIKPILVMLAVMYIVNKPDCRSAASSHWLLLLATVSPLVVLLFFIFFPALDLSVLPVNFEQYTRKPVLSPAAGMLTTANTIAAGALLLYCVGVFFVLGHMLRAITLTCELTRHTQLARGRELAQLQTLLANKFSLTKPVSIRVGEQVRAPATWGFRRPEILLPAQYRDWPAGRLARVLAHEYAHIARNDWLSKLTSRTLCALFWFNPLIWRVARESAHHAELACDDLVVTIFQCRADYADDLLELSTDATHRFALAFIQQSALYLRISAILDGAKNREAPGRYLRLTNVVSLFLLILPLAVLQVKPVQAKHAPTLNSHLAVPLNLVPEIDGLDTIPEGDKQADTKNRLDEIPEAIVSIEELRKQYSVPNSPQLEEAEWVTGQHREGTPAGSSETEIDAPLQLALSWTRVANSHAGQGKLSLETDDKVEPHKSVLKKIPGYPARALRRNIEGKVIVEMDVAANGKVINPRIIAAEPAAIFNKTVLKSVRQFIYQPMKINGQAITTKNVTETFIFQIEDTADTSLASRY